MASSITVGSGASDNTIIGFRWDTSDSSPRLYQIDSTGTIIANKDATFWDNWNITGNMKTVVVNATSNTVVYGSNNRGDGLDLSGASGDVMVEIPRFYTCSTYANGNFSYWISPLPASGFTVAPMFNQRGYGTEAGTPASCYYVGRYDANLVGSTLQSATGKAPAVSMTIGQARTWAENKGAGWGITNVWTLSGLRQLFYTEMLTLNSQTAWTKSRGIVDNCPPQKNSGADSIDTQIYANNATGSGTGDDGKTPVSYRGIENLWGNVYQFQDGFNAYTTITYVISPTGLGLTGQKTTFKDLLDANDVQSVGALVQTDGWQSNLMNTDVARPLFLPSAVGGSGTTYLSDWYLYPPSQITFSPPNILISGGVYTGVSWAGIGNLYVNGGASYTYSDVGARVEFRRSTAAAPTFGSIVPTSGPTAGNTPVIITGTNLFGAGAGGANNVTFDGALATSITVDASGTSITANTSAHAAGPVNVVITTLNGTATGMGAYTYVAAPTFGSIAPTSGPEAGGTAVTITGTGFNNTGPGLFNVAIGGNPADSVILVNPTTITAVTLLHSPGAVDVVITNNDGQTTTEGTGKYTYGAVPTFTSIAPTAGSTAGNTPVTITGTNLYGANAPGTNNVTLGGALATGVSVGAGGTSITANTPAHAAGTFDVVITTPNGTATGINNYTFIDTSPTFGSIVPTAGSTAGNTPVTITGTNLYGASAGGTNNVTFGGALATGVSVGSGGTSITANTPAHAAGPVNVVITTPNGTATGTSAYTYVEGGGGGGGGPGPGDSGISGISPGSGTSGTQIQTTITGSNFPTTTKKNGAGTTTIKVWLSQLGEGSIIGKEVNVLSATKLTCTFNLAGAHPGKWTVNAKRSDGFITAVLTDAFTVKPAPAVPEVHHITPSMVKAGTKAFILTITGEHFAKGNRVQWKGVARETTFVSVTTLRAKVLAIDIAKAGRYLVSVYRPGRDKATSNGMAVNVRK